MKRIGLHERRRSAWHNNLEMYLLTAGDRPGTVVVGLLGLAMLVVCDGAQAQVASKDKDKVRVPFVGCESDGQAGPVEAPEDGTILVSISKAAGQQLAYYKAVSGVGVLAPRGWNCFCTYGSSGERLYVSAEPIEGFGAIRGPKALGQAVQLAYTLGDGSGSIAVAETVARVFPAYRSHAIRVMDGFDVPESERVFGPYPRDILIYRSEKTVEFTTPAGADGLGTRWLPKNDRSISGVDDSRRTSTWSFATLCASSDCDGPVCIGDRKAGGA